MLKPLSRRRFVLGCSAAIGSAGYLRAEKLLANSGNRIEMDGIEDPRLKKIVQSSIDAAVAAGASYVDARLSHSESFQIDGQHPALKENMAFGVRVLAEGYWGFASSPEWSEEEAIRLGKAAVVQAKANVFGSSGNVRLSDMVNTESGHWLMPVKDDPFEMAFDEILDYNNALRDYIGRFNLLETAAILVEYCRISKVFGSSTGQYITQRLYKTGGKIFISLSNAANDKSRGTFHDISPAGLGFEHLRDQPLRERLRAFHHDLVASLDLPVTHIDVGRYDTLLSASGVADLINKTIGRPTEIDTALGFEANAGGVGFIDPYDMLGTYRLGSSLLNITGDRSAAGSVGRVRWDDEGVAPVKIDIIKDGIVANMQCNREGAQMIGDHFTKTGQVVQSHGCSHAPTALDVPMVHCMDLSMRSNQSDSSLDDLRGGMVKGIELHDPITLVDFQGITGAIIGNMFEIRNGKRVARYNNGNIIFRTPELWNNLIGLGGPGSVARFGLENRKGQPQQISSSSVFSVPAVFKELSLMRNG